MLGTALAALVLLVAVQVLLVVKAADKLTEGTVAGQRGHDAALRGAGRYAQVA